MRIPSVIRSISIFILFIGALLIYIIGNKPPESIFIKENHIPAAVSPESHIKFSAEKIPLELTGQDYFVNYRLERDRFRQETKEMLAILLDSNVQQTQIEAQKNWLELLQSIKKEGEIENVLKMKGFRDVVANINSNSVNIMVLAPSLVPEQISLIQDIVVKITGIRMDRISISARN